MDTTGSTAPEPQSSTSVGATLTSYNITEVSFDRLSVGTIDATGTISAGGFVTGASPDPRIEITASLIAGYSDATTKQFYLSATDGKAYFAGGQGYIDTDGITLNQVSGESGKRILFNIGTTTEVARVWAQSTLLEDSLNLRTSKAGQDGPARLQLYAYQGSDDAVRTDLQLYNYAESPSSDKAYFRLGLGTKYTVETVGVYGEAGDTTTPDASLTLWAGVDQECIVKLWHDGASTNIVGFGGTMYGPLLNGYNGNFSTVAWSIDCTTGATTFNEDGDAAGDFRVESDTETNMLLVDADGDTDGALYMGGTTNGVKVTKGGEMSFLGTATVWDDLRFDASMLKTGTSAPGFAQFKDNGAGSVGVFIYWFDKTTPEYVFFCAQLPHSWAGTAIYPHVHWVPKTADATGLLKVRWGLEYTWVDIGGTYGNTSFVYALSAGGHTTAGKHEMTSWSSITPSASQDGISSMLVGRLFRNAPDANDTYDDDAGLLGFDIHYEMNTVGSKTESAK